MTKFQKEIVKLQKENRILERENRLLKDKLNNALKTARYWKSEYLTIISPSKSAIKNHNPFNKPTGYINKDS